MKPYFILTIAGTNTIHHPGISAAGASHSMLSYTAALDAEFIYCGKTKTLDKLPVSPSGITSPALISKACLNLLDAPYLIIDAGAHINPNCPHISVYNTPSQTISQGQALDPNDVEDLYSLALESELPNFDPSQHYLMLAECVVGGTTTALGLLKALGYDCPGMISSSIPNGNHQLKEQLVNQGYNKALERNPDLSSKINDSPLLAIATMGDAMQAVVAGLAIQASKRDIPVTLAGGSQMLAIKALIDKLIGNNELIEISSSPWVINDSSARFRQLLKLCCPDTKLNSASVEDIQNIEGLDDEIQKLSSLKLASIINSYSQNNVKEGVGMGALLKATLQQQTLCLPA